MPYTQKYSKVPHAMTRPQDLAPIIGDPLFLAYLASIIDGEGCIGVHTSCSIGYPTYYSAQLRIAQAHEIGRAFLSDIQKLIGGLGTVRCWDKNCWSLALLGPSAVRVLKAVLPYLVIKKEQAELVIKLQELKLHSRKDLNQMKVA